MANGFPPKKSKCIGMIGGGGHTIHHRAALGTKHDDGKVRVVDFFVVLVNVAARFFPLAISVAAAQTLHDKPAWRRCAALGAIFRCG